MPGKIEKSRVSAAIYIFLYIFLVLCQRFWGYWGVMKSVFLLWHPPAYPTTPFTAVTNKHKHDLATQNYLKLLKVWTSLLSSSVFKSHNIKNAQKPRFYKEFWAIKKARDGIRTRGPRLGKAMLHHWATRAFPFQDVFFFNVPSKPHIELHLYRFINHFRPSG